MTAPRRRDIGRVRAAGRSVRRGGRPLAAALLVLLHATAAEAEIAPHSAFYDLSLAQAESGSGIASVSGVMTYELDETCDSWVLTQRLVFVVGMEDGAGSGSDIVYTAWESKDGRAFVFHTRIRSDDKSVEEVKGSARFPAAGRAGIARFVLPAESQVALPAGTALPVAHSAEVLRRAAAGETFLTVPFFDGSSTDGALMASVFVGARRAPAEGGAANVLRRGPSWRVSAAFYPLSGAVELPQYRTAFRLWESGVADDVRIDYGNYALAGKLQRIVALPRPDCAPAPSGR